MRDRRFPAWMSAGACTDEEPCAYRLLCPAHAALLARAASDSEWANA